MAIKHAMMSVKEVCEEMRDAGLPACPWKVADLIEDGVFNFGVVVRRGKKKRSFIIWRVDFEKWLEERTKGGEYR